MFDGTYGLQVQLLNTLQNAASELEEANRFQRMYWQERLQALRLGCEDVKPESEARDDA